MAIVKHSAISLVFIGIMFLVSLYLINKHTMTAEIALVMSVGSILFLAFLWKYPDYVKTEQQRMEVRKKVATFLSKDAKELTKGE